MGTVERALADRVAALPDRTRAAVLLVAADDDPGAATGLAALPAAGLDVGDLGAAEAAGLLSVDGRRLTVRHPLARSAADGLAPFEERRRAHAALAEALSGRAEPPATGPARPPRTQDHSQPVERLRRARRRSRPGAAVLDGRA
jgi:hypothetical protein